MAKIDVKDISSGSMNGELVWVCDYRRPDLHKKAARNVPVQKVLVVSSDDLNQKIYYSNSAFLKLNKNGLATKQVVKLFDNTGFRTYAGVPLNVFDNESECVACWNRQIGDVVESINLKKQIVIGSLNDQEEDLRSMLK